MAEFLDLGKHCFLDSCKKLDYTPFYCVLCSHYYCSEHRFVHGCNSSRFYTGVPSSSAPLKPYLCSKQGCLTYESVRIVCENCSLNFCLQHRYCVDHDCTEIPEKKRRAEAQKKIAAVREKLGIDSTSKQPAVVEDGPKPAKVKKVVSEAEQQKLDRVALMKLKLKDKSGLGPNEKLIVFVEWDDGRQPVVISKAWTVGKVVDSVKKELGISTQVSSVSKKGTDGEVDFSETAGQLISEMDTLLFK